MIKILQSKLAIFLGGLIFSSLSILLYILTINNSLLFYIFGIVFALIILIVYKFLFTQQTEEELTSPKTYFLYGLTTGFCLIWGSFLYYVILISH